MAYIKGIFIQDIFSNHDNGYMVGLMRVKESDILDKVNKVITFTGMFDELKYKATYKMEGEFVNHNKYGSQFQVVNYELVLPTDEEEIIEFLSSDLFPIGERTAEKIVNKLGKNTINTMINDPHALDDIPRLSDDKKDKILEILNDYQATSHIVIELNKIGFSTKNSLALLKKYSVNSIKKVEENIYDLIDDIDITFNELDNIARNNGYELNDERRLLALTIYIMNTITFNNGDTYSYFDEIYNYILKYTDNIDRDTFEYILLKLSKLNKVKIDKDRYYLKEFYDAEHYIVDRLIKLNDKERRDKIRKICKTAD